MSWLDGDLKIFAAGLAVGGEWNLGSIQTGDIVTCYNDEGEYDHFYMQFKKPVAEFSFGQFLSTVTLLGKNGIIPVLNAARISGTTIKVSTNLETEDQGVMVVGKQGGYLAYLSGASVPGFVAALMVSGLDTLTPLAYIWDRIAIQATARTQERVELRYPGLRQYAVVDGVEVGGQVGVMLRETVEFGYYAN